MKPLSTNTAWETWETLFYDQHDRVLYPTQKRRSIPIEGYQELFFTEAWTQDYKRIRFQKKWKHMQFRVSGHTVVTTNFTESAQVSLESYWLPWCTLGEIGGNFSFYNNNTWLDVYRTKESPVPLQVALDTVQENHGFRMKLADNKGWLFNQN
jgi:hypothetical protein